MIPNMEIESAVARARVECQENHDLKPDNLAADWQQFQKDIILLCKTVEAQARRIAELEAVLEVVREADFHHASWCYLMQHGEAKLNQCDCEVKEINEVLAKVAVNALKEESNATD